MSRAAIGLAFVAFLAVDGSAGAEPREPLTVTQLADPEARLQVTSVAEKIGDPTAGDGIDDFSRAVGEALRVQRQAIERKCRSNRERSAPVAGHWAWEASCRYQRY